MREDDRFVAQVQPRQRVQRVVVRAAAVPVGRVHQAGGVPEVVDRGVGHDVGVPRLGHPVVPELGVVDVGEAVDERLHSRGVGVLAAPVDPAGEDGGHRLPQHRRRHAELPRVSGQVLGVTNGGERGPAGGGHAGGERGQVVREVPRSVEGGPRGVPGGPGGPLDRAHPRSRLSRHLPDRAVVLRHDGTPFRVSAVLLRWFRSALVPSSPRPHPPRGDVVRRSDHPARGEGGVMCATCRGSDAGHS